MISSSAAADLDVAGPVVAERVVPGVAAALDAERRRAVQEVEELDLPKKGTASQQDRDRLAKIEKR